MTMTRSLPTNLTRKQLELIERVRAVVQTGAWSPIDGRTIRWMREVETPENIPAKWWPGKTYTQLVFLTIIPGKSWSLILGVAPAPWVGRQDTTITFKRAFEVLDDPAALMG